MSLMKWQSALARIKLSETDLAVFQSPDKTMLDVVFAHTVLTKEKIKNKDPDFIGVFNKDSPPNLIKSLCDFIELPTSTKTTDS